ncbi:hypothetical protein CEQ90_16345 [Lewinellaceae bacterium SD302]|nr:hypothetical protein CEQ90_16345 [Lewinellaceae bacterium SD302]
MRIQLLFIISFCCLGQLFSQDQKPAYCDNLPSTYGSVVVPPGGSPPPPLPRFATIAQTEYKVQVAILRDSDPRNFPFHPTLVARYRPCEQVWVVESRESFANRSEADALKNQLIGLGYQGAYITDLVAYN